MNKAKSMISGKWLLSAIGLMALVGFAVWHINTPSISAQSVGGFEGAILTITPAAGQSFSVTGLTAGPFSIQGTITTATGCASGVFYRTGTKLAGGAAVVQDVYVLQCFNGAIMAEGVLNPDLTGALEQANLTAVTGGIGTFRGAEGEMQITTNSDGTFTARLLEVPRRSGDDRLRGSPPF